MLTALTRPPTDAIAHCELTHLERQPIDVALAIEQQRAYERALEECGARVVSLAPEPDLPDAVFVEDTAVVLDDVAVIARPGAASRQAETESVSRVLSDFRPLVHLAEPATLDGGDVLRVGNQMFVGVSTRTNAEGIRQIGTIARRHGCETRPVPVGDCLHLKSACTHVGGGLLIVNPALVDVDLFVEFELLHVLPDEPGAANTVLVGECVMIAESFPGTADLLVRLGLDVHTVDLSELQKAEAGGSCMSILLET
jgi:dimethylargininase